jgi:hypothetical protein
MAGDWIKFEHATLDKPEVARMAELLGINRNEMLGVLLNYFVWLDRNCSHGHVTHMSRLSLDSILHMSGFSACLCDVGWAEVNETTGILTVKNWERHNGKPAKTRALAKDRKAEERSRKSHAESVTREEKRRDKPIHTLSAGRKLTSLPADFSISERVRGWATEKGHRRLDERLEHFVGYAKRSGKRYADWDEAFMSAVREDWAKLNGPDIARPDVPLRVAL